ncbi:hypothetical protein VSX61_22145 [Brenneria populi subsp. brevivirga]|uniref:hypothetical protein n=1 Tax=Brenneria populi TaxID=1505588 RepID=UPI002E176740|nr:hypothetical protein [Brenneria populi subsp. brevivirga]
MNISKERLEEIAGWYASGITAVIPTRECTEMARRLLVAEAQLAGLQKQEPYGWDCGGAWVKSKPVRDVYASDGYKPVPLYAAPVPPAASQPDDDRSDALCDLNYAHGVVAGWNYAQNGDDYGMRKCVEDRISESARVLLLIKQPLPTASQPPVVPDEATPDSIEILASIRPPRCVAYQWDEDQRNAAADAWNACRAAMLQSQPVSKSEFLPNSPVIPDCCDPHRIKPVLPERDYMGFWCHPNRAETPFDEGSTLQEMRTWYAERGMDVGFTYMNQFFCGDCVYDACDENIARHWNPTPPENGDGWILLSIFDTEDGAAAEWVRYKDGDA